MVDDNSDFDNAGFDDPGPPAPPDDRFDDESSSRPGFEPFPEPDLQDDLPELPNYDPAVSNPDDVAGEPHNDMAHWHQQNAPDTCAIAAQEFVLEDLLPDQDFTEEELRDVATDNGWYSPGYGTPMYHTGSVLEAYGIDVERQTGGTMADIEQVLNSNQKVIVGLDAEEVWTLGQDTFSDDFLNDVGLNTLPGQDANHAVEVIGIDRTNPDAPMVVLNDPGHPDGRGATVTVDEFVDAWEDSGHFMMYTTGADSITTSVESPDWIDQIGDVRVGYTHPGVQYDSPSAAVQGHGRDSDNNAVDSLGYPR